MYYSPFSAPDTLQAAILLEKLKIYPDELDRRQAVADRYCDAIAHWYKLQTVPAECRSVWAQYVTETEDRAECMRALREAGSSSNVYYRTPLHRLPAYADLGYEKGDFPVSESVSDRIMALPMHPYLTIEQQNHICNTLVLQTW